MATAKKALQSDKTEKVLEEQIENLRNELSGLTETVSGLAQKSGQTALSTAKDARDTVVDRAETAALYGMEAHDLARDTLRNRPIATLGAAVGVGFVIGAIAGRRQV